MSRDVYLHVGVPKTGTTYLQDRLRGNAESLAAQGVHYPLAGLDNHFDPALDLIERPWGGRLEHVHGEWASLVRQVRSHEGTVVVSHEILACATREQVQRAVEDLGVDDVHVVVTARDLARQVPAEWQEAVKHQQRAPFAKFVERVQAASRADSDLWFWRVQSLSDVLTRWAEGLPPDRVHVVTVPQGGSPKDLLWERFCEAISIDPAWGPEDAARQNVSIGIAETTLLRRLNRRLRRADSVPNDQYARLVRDLVVHRTLAQRPDMTKATTPPELTDWLREVTQEWLEWIRGSGVHVVGDLAELEVPDPTGDWVDPDSPRATDMVEAALDAMVALVEEAARTAPEPPSPLQKVTNRLRGR